MHSKSSTPIIEGAGPTGGGGGGGALGRWRCLLRWPPRDLTPANRAPFGVSAVATTAVMSARRIATACEETTSDNPLRAATAAKRAVAVLALGALWRYQLALLAMHQLIDDKCNILLKLLREFTQVERCLLPLALGCRIASVLQAASPRGT